MPSLNQLLITENTVDTGLYFQNELLINNNGIFPWNKSNIYTRYIFIVIQSFNYIFLQIYSTFLDLKMFFFFYKISQFYIADNVEYYYLIQLLCTEVY